MAYDIVVDSTKLNGAMTATANAIRENTGDTEPIEWDENNGFKDSIVAVYEAGKESGVVDVFTRVYEEGYSSGQEVGYSQGYSEGESIGITNGRKAEYDRFWDAYQSKGRRNMYDGAFSGTCWTADNFKPKYNLENFKSAINMFWSSLMQIDLASHLEGLGIVLDFSNVTSMRNAFAYSNFTRLGVLDLRKATSASDAFPFMYKLVTIDKIIVSENTMLTYWFNQDTALTHVIFEGTIGKSLDIHWSPLDKESIISVVNALSTSTTASGLTVTLSKSAVDKAFETTDGANDGEFSTEWATLIAPYLEKWNISLANA